MATVPNSTNQGNPSDENLGPFPYVGNVGAPYMATLSLPEFTIGFPVWLFSSPMVMNIQTSSQPSSPPPEQHQPHVDPKVNPLPSSPIASSSHSPSSPGESIDSSK